MFRAIINGLGEAFKKGDEMIYNIFSNKFFGDRNIQRKKDKIIEQSNEYKELLRDSHLKRERFLDTCFLGGILLEISY